MKNILEYIVVIFSIITSGSIIYTTYNDDLILIGFLMFLVFIFIITKKVSFNKYYFYYFIFSTAYFAIHPFLLGDISIINKYLGTIVRLSSFLLAISILGSRKFCYIYVKVMFVLCLLNLLLYIDHVYLLL